MILREHDWDELLRRTAFYADNHAIKGAMAIEMLSAEPEFADLDWAGWLNAWQVLDSPRVAGLMAPLCEFDLADFSAERLFSIVRQGVFPLSYAACAELVARMGLTGVVAAFRAHVLASLDDLGHTLTIWESFVTLSERPLSEAQRCFAAERLAEFLGSPSFARRGDAGDLHVPAEPLRALVPRAVRAPGFMGHTVITLSTALRMSLAPEEQAAVLRVLTPVMDGVTLPTQNLLDGTPSLTEAVRHFLLHGPRDVHTLTFARAAWDLRGLLRGDDEAWLAHALMAESARVLRRA